MIGCKQMVEHGVQINGTELRGHSLSAERTSFILPKYGIVIDAGLPYFGDTNLLLISHGHGDHTANMVSYLLNDRPTTIIYPAQAADLFEQLICGTLRLNYNNNKIKRCGNSVCLGKHVYANVFALAPSHKIKITVNKHKLVIGVIRGHHTIPTNCYLISETRNKLKPEFKGLSGSAIASLKRSNIEVTEPIEFPLIAYLLDTTVQVFQSKHIFDFPIILVECTFILPEDLVQAKKKKHMHWSQLKPLIQRHPENIFVLTHFSQKHVKDHSKLDFFKKQKPIMKNLLIWLDQADPVYHHLM